MTDKRAEILNVRRIITDLLDQYPAIGEVPIVDLYVTEKRRAEKAEAALKDVSLIADAEGGIDGDGLAFVFEHHGIDPSDFDE